jgi:hypothetical protein
MWINHYNFVCLLNLEKCIQRFGPLRNYWEGSNKGEGYLRIIKPELNQGLRMNWAPNLLLKIYRIQAFMLMNTYLEKYNNTTNNKIMIIDEEDKAHNKFISSESIENSIGMYKRYDNYTTAMKYVTRENVLSVIHMDNNDMDFYICLKDNLCIRVKREKEFITKIWCYILLFYIGERVNGSSGRNEKM